MKLPKIDPKKFIPNIPISLCCTVFSLWGVLFLGVILAFCDTYPVMKGSMLDADFDFTLLRINLGVAIAMYLAFVIGCGIWAVIQIIKKIRTGSTVEYY
ncbi:Uncharacterized protein QTN25_003134 [Entamoeba marina]